MMYLASAYRYQSMTSDLDIYRSAKLLIAQHGEDAPIFAAMRADELAVEGDLDGSRVWMGVIRAIKELTNTDSAEGGRPVH